MNAAGLICEYNPFHNGHKYMLEKIREEGSKCIIACMSGNFTQRGDPAIINKHLRTKAALENGVDLVIELPVIYACSGAESFARGGVHILNSLGICSRLYFGSECGNVEKLSYAAEAVKNNSVKEPLHHYLSEGLTFAAARENAVKDVYGREISDILKEPNNILAIEYINSLLRSHSNIAPHTIQRVGTSHDSTQTEDCFASASRLRQLLYAGESINKYIPENTSELYNNSTFPHGGRLSVLERTILYRMRSMSTEDFSKLPDMSEGLENRLIKAVRSCNTVEEILQMTKCKRYTMSRIRRSIIHSLLGLSSDDFNTEPQYIKILGFNDNGRKALKEMKKHSLLPVIIKYSDTSGLSKAAKRMYETECRCDDIYALSGSTVTPCGSNMRNNPVIVNCRKI